MDGADQDDQEMMTTLGHIIEGAMRTDEANQSEKTLQFPTSDTLLI